MYISTGRLRIHLLGSSLKINFYRIILNHFFCYTKRFPHTSPGIRFIDFAFIIFIFELYLSHCSHCASYIYNENNKQISLELEILFSDKRTIDAGNKIIILYNLYKICFQQFSN